MATPAPKHIHFDAVFWFLRRVHTSNVLKRRTLSSAELDDLTQRLAKFLEGENLKKLLKKGATAADLGKATVVSIGSYYFVVAGGTCFPALAQANSRILDRLPSVYVDRGAVQKIANGADVMRPGITRMDAFEKDDVVVVRDDVHSKPLAVGQALASSVEAAATSHGRVVKNLHHVDDTIWKNVNNV
uniref:PUA domain-containing protein n=1 Tax=Caldiarchaeum subterraneum TaxID=311458 RepID=A0A7C5L770_CALS0